MVTPGARRSRFDTTHWSLVLAAGADQSPDGRAALATLCEIYWYPLYAFVRRQGHDADDAQDLTQAFFARLLEKQDLQDVERARGRFRSFLLAAMKHFLMNDAKSRRTLKRGGGHAILSLSLQNAEGRYLNEPADPSTPETLFDRRWALTVIDRALRRLRGEAADAGRVVEFDRLKACLTGDIPRGSYRAIGVDLDMSEGAVKVAVHRLRRRFQRGLRKEIAETVLSDEQVDEEIQYLLRALATPSV